MDVAQLGIQVSSKGTSQATAELTKLANVAKVAEQAVEGLSSKQNAARAALATAKGYQSQSAAALAAARASDSASQEDIKAAQAAYQKAQAVTAAAKADLDAVNASLAAAKADQQQANAALKAAQAMNQATAAANDNVTKVSVNAAALVKTHNASNLAAQGFDIVTSAAGGMSAGLIGMQQGLQVAQVAMTSTNGFAKDLAASFMAMLSPVTFLAVALTTLAAVGIQQVNWAKLAASALTAVSGVLQEIAPYAVGAAAALALLYAPAIIGGVVQLIALMGRLATQALALAAAFAAANPAAAFVLGITAAVAAANIFRDELTNIFGVDIVGAAKTGVNFIIGSFVGAFNDLKFVWAQFPNIIGAAAVGAANAAIGAIEKMINAATGMLNSLIQSVNNALGELPGGFQIGEIGSVDFGRIENPYASALSGAVADRNAALQNALSADYLGGFGTAIAKGASTASSKLKELAKDITTVDEKSKKKGGKTEAEKYSDIVDGANRRIASLKAEQAALGMTEEAALKLKYETELLNQAQQKGINLTAAQRAELSGLASQMAATEIATKNAKEALDFAKTTTAGFVNDLRNGLRNGESFWTSFGKAALGVLDRITDKLLNEVLDAIFKVNSSAAGGGGGLLGGILNLFGGGSSQFSIASAGGIGLYADGTSSARSGLAVVGERGPELVRFRGGEQVIPNHRIYPAANQNAAGVGDTNVNVTFAPVINAPNADAAGLSAVRQDLAKLRSELPGVVVDTVKNAQKRRIL